MYHDICITTYACTMTYICVYRLHHHNPYPFWLWSLLDAERRCSVVILSFFSDAIQMEVAHRFETEMFWLQRSLDTRTIENALDWHVGSHITVNRCPSNHGCQRLRLDPVGSKGAKHSGPYKERVRCKHFNDECCRRIHDYITVWRPILYKFRKSLGHHDWVDEPPIESPIAIYFSSLALTSRGSGIRSTTITARVVSDACTRAP